MDVNFYYYYYLQLWHIWFSTLPSFFLSSQSLSFRFGQFSSLFLCFHLYWCSTRLCSRPSSLLSLFYTTLIDHIYYRSKSKQAVYNIDKAINGVIVTDITDHLANCLVLPFCLPFKSSPDRPLIRLFSQENKSKFCSECLSYDWTNNVYNCSDVNVAYDNFYIFLKNTFEKCFPLVKLSRKRSKDKKWITQEIIKLSKIKSNLYKTWVNTHLLSDKDKYKVFVKSYNGVIQAAKSNYYRTTFDSKIHDIKTIWQNINKLHSFK